MFNYPFFSLIKAYIASKFSKRVKIEDETTLSMRCGFSDIDPYLEINNGRYQTLADIGRFNHGFRTGLIRKAKKNKIYFTVAGASVKYRYRIPFGEKFKMTTKIIYVDDKWTYYLHKFIVKKYNLHQLSTGELLRQEIKNKTRLGEKIESIIS